MRPYYEQDGITIYHADWRDVVPHIGTPIDALVTDPPYGIRADERQAARANKQHGKALAPSRDYGHSSWDRVPPRPADLARLLEVGKHHIIWGGNHFGLPPSRGWLVWDKETGSNGYADCELAWTDLPMAIRRIRFQWMGFIQQVREPRYHPTQKPLPVMEWVLGWLPKGSQTILDPYMGSGTTLVAAQRLGHSAVGIEADERYCEIAAKRLSEHAPALALEAAYCGD